MATDWKDLLGALKESGAVPEDSSPDQVQENENGPEKQKSALHVVTDRKGRKGKTATIVEGFEITDEEVEEVARKLKQKLGTGGSVRDGEILIQGDRKCEVVAFLKGLGFKVKG